MSNKYSYDFVLHFIYLTRDFFFSDLNISMNSDRSSIFNMWVTMG